MKRFVTSCFAVLILAGLSFSQTLETLWETSAANESLPEWFSASGSTERGFAAGSEFVFVVSRNGGTNVRIMDAATGLDEGTLDMTGIAGGTFLLNDAGVTGDGQIFACNLTIDGSTSPFRVYNWTDTSAAPVEVITYTGYDGSRFGDKFTVTGSVSDNSVEILAVSANSDTLYKWTTADNGASYDLEKIDFATAALTSPSAGPVNGSFYVNSNGALAEEFDATTGMSLGQIDGAVLATGSNAIRYFSDGVSNFVTSFQYGGGNENARIIDVTDGNDMASSVLVTPTLGSNGNGNGTGDVEVIDNGDGTFNVFAMSTNNGVGAYKFTPAAPMNDTLNVVFENSAANETLPAWFSPTGNTERGFAYGNGHLYVVSRNGGTTVKIVDAETGADVGDLSVTGVSGGVFLLNDAEVDDDGIIYAANLVTDATSSPFRVYKWTDEQSDPVEIITYGDNALRLGDKFTVTGSAGDNSLTIWAAGSGSSTLVKFTTADNGASFTANEVTVDPAFASSAAVYGSFSDGFYANSNGTAAREYDATGTFLSEVPTTILGSGSNALRTWKDGLRKVLTSFQYGSGKENARLVDVTFGNASAESIVETPSLGSNGNLNGAGDVDFRANDDGSFTVYVMSTNNGFGAYNVTLPEVQLPLANLVINEINYNGPESGTDTTEFIEIYNADGDVVDLSGFYFSAGVDFTFPQGASVEPADYLVVAFDSSAFRNTYGFDADYVWTSGGLSNGGEQITLNDNNDRVVDDVTYDDAGGWPTSPDGSGPTLELIDPALDNSLAENWQGSYVTGGTPGAMNSEMPEPETVAIAEIQMPTDTTDASPYAGQLVTIKGLVTAAGDESYFIQNGDSAWSGVYVYIGAAHDAQVGDSAFVTGTVTEYFNLTEITDVTEYSLINSGNPLPAPIMLPTGDVAAEQWEGVLISVQGFVDNPDLGFGEWSLDDGSGPARVDDLFYAFVPDSGSEYMVTGPLTYTFSNFKIEPRNEDDVELIIIFPEPEDLLTVWAQAEFNNKLPSYMETANTTRGMAYGNVNGNDRLYVVTRTGSPRIYYHDALTGDSLGMMEQPTPAVGLFPLNVVDVSDDGVIFASNMTLNADGGNPFTVYRWDSETSTPEVVISDDSMGGRMGDMISVYGSTSDNSVTIYAGVKDDNRIARYTTSDNGHTFTRDIITLPSGTEPALGTNPNVAQASDGSLWVKSFGRPLVHVQSDGTPIDTVSGEVLSTGASKIKYFSPNEGEEYILAYYANVSGTDELENMVAIDVSNGAALAYVKAETPTLGMAQNLNASGSVDSWMVNGDTFVFFVMGTNNGLGAFTNDDNFVIANKDTLFYGDTRAELALSSANSGYVTGTNGYDDVGKYQRFDLSDGDELCAFTFYFGAVQVVDIPDSIDFVVRGVGENGAPAAIIATVKATTEMIDTSASGNTFFLDKPLTAMGPLFVGVEWPVGGGATANDTLAIIHDEDGEGDGADRVWEQFSDGAFNDFGTVVFPNFSWGLDIDLHIAAHYTDNTPVSLADEREIIPERFSLSQNYPNPFNPTTTIDLSLPMRSKVKVEIFNVLGQKIMTLVDGSMPAGTHKLFVDGSKLSSGVYFYKVKAGQFEASKKMVLIK